MHEGRQEEVKKEIQQNNACFAVLQIIKQKIPVDWAYLALIKFNENFNC